MLTHDEYGQLCAEASVSDDRAVEIERLTRMKNQMADTLRNLPFTFDQLLHVMSDLARVSR